MNLGLQLRAIEEQQCHKAFELTEAQSMALSQLTLAGEASSLKVLIKQISDRNNDNLSPAA
ncbi:MAG: hypothetical protein ACPH3H_11460 [Pseudomonadales bacterium]